ncbi:MAG: hypothetical protein JWP89_1405 [Schlesneria sp.]|nr:hypothetical protein [Schlesneria sp.]
MIKSVALPLLLAVLACDVANAAEDDGTASLSFDGIVLGRVLTEVELRPLFFDFDTGRFMAPPPGVLNVEAAQPYELAELNYTDKLKAWIRQEGLDAAFQTDGQSITIVIFEMKVGTWWEKAGNLPKRTPQSIIEDLKSVENDKWVSFQEVIPKEKHRAMLPFVTREGGVGQLSYLEVGELFSPSSISLRYEIARLDLSKNPVPQVPEPAILQDFANYLVVSANDGQLQLRVPAGRGTIIIQKDTVVVTSATHRDLIAERIGSGWLDVDAARKRVLVRGHGGEVMLRAVGNRVRVDMDKRVAYDTRITISLPKVEVGPMIKWNDK